MRSSSAACAILVLLMGTVDAEQCPPGALGVSRTLVVDPNEHPRVGSMQYPDIGDPQGVSPFFRIPGLLRQKSVEQYLAAHGDMTWSADFLADDWTRINDSEVARRAISRIEARGKGILLLQRHPPSHRPRAARNSQRVKKPRLQDRSCGSGSGGPAENRNLCGAMGCSPHARAAYEFIAKAPTAPRNISPPWIAHTTAEDKPERSQQ